MLNYHQVDRTVTMITPANCEVYVHKNFVVTLLMYGYNLPAKQQKYS